MSQPEDTDQAAQLRKTGSAATLLSLDCFLPFYPYLDVPAPAPQVFRDVIRASILENRAAFDADKSRIPDLRGVIDRNLLERLGDDTVRRFDWWHKNVFIQGPGDFRAFFTWETLLLRAQNVDHDWSDLSLPARISDDAREVFLRAIDKTQISELDDQLDKAELSEWDLDMYTRHGLDDEFADPWLKVSSMFGQLRYRKFMNWLLSRLSSDERDAFHRGASQVASRYRKLEPHEMLPDPATQLLPDAYDFR
ncbi:MAG TPA: hypothetical protein PK677_16985 [Acidiphilium sp.]|nr:hypothetical protein [Acidiphilium sp.]